MHTVIVIPGIMGTALELPNTDGGKSERVWPPTLRETKFGYKRRDKLIDPNVRPTSIISNVLCVQFYSTLLNKLERVGFTEAGDHHRLITFPYDWRLDLFNIAEQLEGVIAKAHFDGATKITLVAHSMGGLITRLVLEDPMMHAKPWFAAIDLFIAIATPHMGAPLALARILGLDSAMGISKADFSWIASHEAYPSAYQLLPAPGNLCCWNQSSLSLETLDIYDPITAERLGLKTTLLDRARAVHEFLGAGYRANRLRYFYFAGSGHRTVTRVNLFTKGLGELDVQRSTVTWTDGAGDGTVLLNSALPVHGQNHIAVNGHTTAFAGDAFHRVFMRLLGFDEGYALQAVGDEARLTLEAPIIESGSTVEVVLSAIMEEGCLTDIDGTLVLTKKSELEATQDIEVQSTPIRYTGMPFRQIQLHLNPICDPGHYILRFLGSPNVAEPIAFSVFSDQQDAN